MKLFHENPVTSWHEHACGLSLNGTLNVAFTDNLVQVMETLGIDRAVSSLPIASDKHCPPEMFIAANNLTYEAVKRWPGRIYGMVFINPGYHDAILAEVDRCVNDLGLWAVSFTIITEWTIPFSLRSLKSALTWMFRSLCILPTQQLRKPVDVSPVFLMASTLRIFAHRYPEATFLMGYIGGGGDWQWSIKAITDCPNVYADMGGSVHDRLLVEESVRYLGADRILFATDGPFSSSVAKILGANITEEEKIRSLPDGLLTDSWIGEVNDHVN